MVLDDPTEFAQPLSGAPKEYTISPVLCVVVPHISTPPETYWVRDLSSQQLAYRSWVYDHALDAPSVP